jgi:eukaryotic-like serine/threonine-protein kinase
VLETPLMLTVMTLAYAGVSVEGLHTHATPGEWRQHLFATYVERMFQRRGAITHYTHQQTEHWLAWLAWQLTQHSQTVFYLERMQPDWLPRRQRWVPTQGSRLLASLLGGLLGGLVGGLAAFALGFGLGSWPGGWLVDLLVGGLSGVLVGGLVGGQAGYSEEIRPIETVRWSWSGFLEDLFLPSGRRLVRGWVVGLLSGLLIGLVQGLSVGLEVEEELVLTWWQGWWSFGLIHGLRSGRAIWFGVILVSGLGIVLGGGLAYGLVYMLGYEHNMLGAGLIIGLVYILSAGLAAGLSGREIAAKTTPNEGIYRSARMALISGLGIGLAGGLLVGLYFGLRAGLGSELRDYMGAVVLIGPSGLSMGLGVGLSYGSLVGLVIGLTTGIRYGGRACLQHLLLRLALRYHGSAPWHYVDFLDYAAERIFLRRVGGGYIFIHRLLQEYFAARQTEPSHGAHSEIAKQGQSALS